jgi:hypothetical protein
VHSNRAGGSGSLDEIARAAEAAGLQFVVVTDHGDATRTPDPPAYRRNVLVLDGVEISTMSGHLIALGLTAASPYPLGAETRDTIEDVHRQGGWAVAAHPDSPKPELRWTEANLPVDGLEWLNADSEWRDEGLAGLFFSVGRYLVRPPEAIASIFDRPTASLSRWDRLSRGRPVVGLAAVDAHARLGFEGDDDDGATVLARPTYEDLFRTVVQAVELEAPLTGDGASDATAILGALRSGRTYSVVSAQAAPGQVTFTASEGNATRRMGQSLETDRPIDLVASVPEPADATLELLRNGEAVASGTGRVTFQHSGGSAVYRAEVRLPGHGVPWIVTNAIRVGPPETEVPDAAELAAGVVLALSEPGHWVVEKHDRSAGAVADAGTQGITLTFDLVGGSADGQYAAAVHPLSGADQFDTVTMTLKAAAPMRVSVQMRAPGRAGGERWQRSVYVDEQPRAVTLRLDDFRPVGETAEILDVARARSLLVVVDSWHTQPGTRGQVWISNVSLGKRRPAGLTSER